MPSRLALLVAILLLALVPLRQSEVHGCASVWRPGETVVVAEESALILWDAAQKIQHFIRWAAFETKAADFGFLVPTPTQPVLAERPRASLIRSSSGRLRRSSSGANGPSRRCFAYSVVRRKPS